MGCWVKENRLTRFTGQRRFTDMDNRPPPIVVRPRKGSDLERAQNDHQNKMADVLHSWATQFALSKTGEKEDDPQ